MAIDPNIALQAKGPDFLNQAGQVLNVAQGAQNLAASRFRLNQEQFQAVQNDFTAIAQDPLIAAAARETNPEKLSQYGQQISTRLKQHLDMAVKSGVPTQLAESVVAPYITMAALHPEQLQQFIAQRQQANIGAAGQVQQTQVGAGGQQNIKYDSAHQPYIEYTDQFGNVSQHPMGWKPPAPNVPVTQSTQPTAQPTTQPAKPQEEKPAIPKQKAGISFRTPEEQARIADATKDIDQIRTGAGMIPQTKQTINKVLDLLNTDTKFGKGSKQWNDAMAYLNTLTGGKVGENSTNYQEANAYIDRLIAQQAEASGNKSVASQNLTAGATGNVDTMNPDALKEKMKNLRGLIAGNEAYRKGLDYWVGTGEKQNPANKSAFDAKFTDAWDTDLFRLKEAADNNDQEEMKNIAAKHSSAEWQAKMKKLNAVVPGYIPKDWIKK